MIVAHKLLDEATDPATSARALVFVAFAIEARLVDINAALLRLVELGQRFEKLVATSWLAADERPCWCTRGAEPHPWGTRGVCISYEPIPR